MYVSELLSVGSVVGEESCHKRCQEEYEQLKEEFERYKLRAQSVLKNKKVSALRFSQKYYAK